MENTKSVRWGRSGRWRAGLAVAGVAAIWAQEVHDRIIEPLGLRRTLIPEISPYVPMSTAAGYTQFPGRDDLIDTTLAVGGGGAHQPPEGARPA